MKMTYVFYCLLLFSFHQLSPLARAESVTILSDEWYPINGDPTASKPGYMIEIARTILAKHDHALDYRIAPWKRSILEVRQGNADCIIGAYKTDAPDFVFPDNAWGKATFNFYTKSDSTWTYRGLSKLYEIRIGVIEGYSYSTELDQHIAENRQAPAIQVTSGDNALEQNIRKLFANRLDAIVSFKPVVMEKLTQLKSDGKLSQTSGLRLAGTLEAPQLLYIACSPNKASSKYYTRIFSQGIVDLRQSGELQKILSKYGIED